MILKKNPTVRQKLLMIKAIETAKTYRWTDSKGYKMLIWKYWVNDKKGGRRRKPLNVLSEQKYIKIFSGGMSYLMDTQEWTSGFMILEELDDMYYIEKDGLLKKVDFSVTVSKYKYRSPVQRKNPKYTYKRKVKSENKEPETNE